MNPSHHNPILCAIDTVETGAAQAIATSLIGHVGGIKLGKEFFTANGPLAVRQVSGNAPLFLDLKFHDIPNTVAGAVRAAVRAMAPAMLTVHASGGPAMLRAATDAAEQASAHYEAQRPAILGVTVLTSLDDDDLRAIGVSANTSEQAKRLAALAQDCGLDGVICSPHEIAALRAQCGAGFQLVVPGIRPAGSAAGDQKRVMTPAQAIDLGADYLVIGRPIAQAANPTEAAAAILESLGPELGRAHGP